MHYAKRMTLAPPMSCSCVRFSLLSTSISRILCVSHRFPFLRSLIHFSSLTLSLFLSTLSPFCILRSLGKRLFHYLFPHTLFPSFYYSFSAHSLRTTVKNRFRQHSFSRFVFIPQTPTFSSSTSPSSSFPEPSIISQRTGLSQRTSRNPSTCNACCGISFPLLTLPQS